jgi:hypothetical protein
VHKNQIICQIVCELKNVCYSFRLFCVHFGTCSIGPFIFNSSPIFVNIPLVLRIAIYRDFILVKYTKSEKYISGGTIYLNIMVDGTPEKEVGNDNTKSALPVLLQLRPLFYIVILQLRLLYKFVYMSMSYDAGMPLLHLETVFGGYYPPNKCA